jgi:hypothetical protein
MDTKILTAKQQMRAAQSFSFFSSLAVIFLPAIIPMLLWIAASIFVYCAVANHPNARVGEYLRYSGYRFYGVVGGLVILLNFSPQLAKAAGGWPTLILLIWVVSFLIVVPLAVRDILRAQHEGWQDMQIEVE